MTELINSVITLCRINGTSGSEHKVREYIISQLNGIPCKTDNMGNLIVEAKGKKPSKNRVMLCAHMDEVGIMARYICSDGLIKFVTVGGIQSSVLTGRQIEFMNGVKGVTGVCPVHLLTSEQKTLQPEIDSLYIDIGTDSAEKTAQYVALGDTGVFYTEPTLMGNKLMSKAIDDRAGCAIMLDMIKKGVEYDTVFVFTVQEEVGLRGAGAAVYGVNPDYAIVLESTTAADIIDAPEDKQICILGKGAAISFMDNRTIYPQDLYKGAFETAKKYGIAAQSKTAVAGGNDAGAIHLSRDGVKTLTISVPCRYIHSPSCVCCTDDITAVRALAEKLAEEYANA